jgi:hypothetical protein
MFPGLDALTRHATRAEVEGRASSPTGQLAEAASALASNLDALEHVTLPRDAGLPLVVAAAAAHSLYIRLICLGRDPAAPAEVRGGRRGSSVAELPPPSRRVSPT